MTIRVVHIGDNIDCYKFDSQIFIEEFEKFVSSDTEILTLREFVLIVIKSYGIIGTTITRTLMNVMATDIKKKDKPVLIRDGIEVSLCFIIRHYIRNSHPDIDLINIENIIKEKWEIVLHTLESEE